METGQASPWVPPPDFCVPGGVPLVAHVPWGAALPVADGACRGVVFKHSDPLAGASEHDCSHPVTGAAENHLPHLASH